MSGSNIPIVDGRHGSGLGRWWESSADGRIVCRLCPRECRLKPGDRGFCFVRQNVDGQMVLDTYGRSTGFCIDPIEKKPLNHFFPGTPVLSFGTAGCNLGCKFCQNWDISKSREVARLSDRASPGDIAAAAHRSGCRSVAFTYNDPVIWAEYAIDAAHACHDLSVKTVAVTAGYITVDARAEFFGVMDAANIDLKSFDDDFYYKITSSRLQPVLDTIDYVCNETDCWVELTNLVIPDANDDGDELQRMCDWILNTVGAEVPVHFTAFHPDFRMTDRPRTSPETLNHAYDIARRTGLHYVYIGNVHDVARQSTYCASCGKLLIERDWHQIGRYLMDGSRCGHCQNEIPGRFESKPGDWGRKRQPIRIQTREPIETKPIETTPARSVPSESSVIPAPAQENAQHEEPEGTMQEATRGESAVPMFSDDQLCEIHRAACRFVTDVVRGHRPSASDALGDLADRSISGVYVSLKRGETLRGCCGLLGPPVGLAHGLLDASTRTAKHDPRMAPIAPIELPHLTVSVSILDPPRPIGARGDDRIDQIEIGKHGLRIAMNGRAGLLLPVVAEERQWDARQFLDAVCVKAGLPAGSWRSDQAELLIFDGIEYGAPMIGAADVASEDPDLVGSGNLSSLRAWVESNLEALLRGATPAYYASHLDDHTVSGVVLQLTLGGATTPMGWMRFSVREGMPLQSTLFQLTQTVAQTLSQQSSLDGGRVDVAVLSTVIHQGNDSQCHLAEFDRQRRALLAMDASRWSVAFDTSAEPRQLLDAAIAQEGFQAGSAQVYSARCESTSDKFSLSNGPKAQPSVTARAPAVAGTFYSTGDQDRRDQVDRLLSGVPDVAKQRVVAAMVPHAGLRFSGAVAAQTWNRIDLPGRLLIIGPKHTPYGVNWAVAPHDSWQLSPTVSIAGDRPVAERIAESVGGMQLDAEAHRREHGIEVQLPILERIAPDSKVSAIAMSGGSFKELQQAARELAACLSSFDDPPLLVISSDMNHFADDEENRRRDRIALQSMKSRDPQQLLEVCQRENISMCGQIPAALVLLTLEAMGIEHEYEEIAYATSADVTGDRSRVVGYAGVLYN